MTNAGFAGFAALAGGGVQKIGLIWLEELLDLIFPPRPVCPLCGETSAGGRVCAACLEQLARFRRAGRCFCCGRGLAEAGAPGPAGIPEAVEVLEAAGAEAATAEAAEASRAAAAAKATGAADAPGAPGPAAVAEPDLKGQNGREKLLCPECLRGNRPFVLARAAGPYEGALKEAIHRYKFGKKRSLARPLGALLAGTVKEILSLAEQGPQEFGAKFSPPPPVLHALSAPPALTAAGAGEQDGEKQVERNRSGRGKSDPQEFGVAAGLVPVPLARQRLAERGFNQAELLAREAAALTGLPMLPVLQKIRETPPQTGLSRRQRQANLSGAFALSPAWQNRPPATAFGCSGATAILVDDVFTTGSTAGECARVLFSAGFRKVYVATLAVAGANFNFNFTGDRG